MSDKQLQDTMHDDRKTRPQTSVVNFIKSPAVVGRLSELMGDKAPMFISTLVFIIDGSDKLKQCEPSSIVSSALQAVSLNLPINPSFGFVHFVPFWDKGTGGYKCQLIVGWRGFGQLALRTGLVRDFDSKEVYEGEIASWNRLTGRAVMGDRKSDTITGYYAFIELVNGFRKEIYITVDQAQAHGRRYSAMYDKGKKQWRAGAKWNDDEEKHAMGKKTAFLMLKKFMPMSVEIEQAAEIESQNFAMIAEQGDEPEQLPEPPKQLNPAELQAGKDALGI